MKPSLQLKLDQLALRLDELNAILSSEDATRDMDRYRTMTREHAEIEPVVARYRDYAGARQTVADAEEMAKEPEMRAFAEEERAGALAAMSAIEGDLQRMLLPRDPNDERNVFLEIRAGTGGDESALFAGNLCRMYLRYAERQRWQTEIVSASTSELGGYREVILRIAGAGAYSKLKFESGGHRVQRVPETEAQGRIHTSACTVAVMPEADPVAAQEINPADLRIDTFRASGAGGQHINKTDSAVRITQSSSARTTARSTATARRRCRCSRRGCSTASSGSASRRRRRCANRWSAAAIAASASAPTTSRRGASPTTGST